MSFGAHFLPKNRTNLKRNLHNFHIPEMTLMVVDLLKIIT